MSGLKLKAKSRRSRIKNLQKANAKKKPAAVSVTPQDFLAQINNRIQGDYISHYRWDAYGPAAIFVDADLPVELGSAQIIVDLTTNQICEMHACDYREAKKNQAWRWINPRYRKAHEAEVKARVKSSGHRDRLDPLHDRFAWDDVRWINVSPTQILKRTRALFLKAEGTKTPAKKKTRRGKL